MELFVIVDCVTYNAITEILFHDVSFMYCQNSLYMRCRLLFYATRYPSRIYKSNLDGSDVTEIVSTGLVDVLSIAINYDTKRVCWADSGKCCISL